MTRPHPADVAYAAYASRRKMFTDGWGDETLLARFERGPSWSDALATIEPSLTPLGPAPGLPGSSALEGTFRSPSALLPPGVATARFRFLRREGNRRACVVVAGSREEGTALREAIYGRLVARGIDLVLLENPYYGTRRAPGAEGPSARSVSEQLSMNAATIEEARALLGWLERLGYAELGVAGYSMGGYVATLVAATTPRPLALAALAAGASAVPVYLEGLLRWSVDFATLGRGHPARARLAALLEPSDVRRLSRPVATRAAVVVGMRRDGYVPARETAALVAWLGDAEARVVDAGHVSAVLLHRAALRAAVASAFARL